MIDLTAHFFPIVCRLALGSELIFQNGGGMEGAMLSLGGRYRAQDWEATARLGIHAWNLSYIHKANKVSPLQHMFILHVHLCYICQSRRMPSDDVVSTNKKDCTLLLHH